MLQSIDGTYRWSNVNYIIIFSIKNKAKKSNFIPINNAEFPAKFQLNCPSKESPIK